MLTMRTFVAFSLLAFSFTFFAPHAVFAASPEGIELNPATFDEKAEPGGTYTYTLKVRNVSDSEKTFFANTRDIKGIDEGGRPEFAEEGEPTPYDLSSWIRIPENEITIPAGGQHILTFSISVPGDATPGSHFGGVFLELEPPRLRQTGAAVGFSVGALINLQIAGDIVENARIRSFTSDKMVYDALPVTIEIRVENLGNTLLRPAGFVEITNMFGTQVANLKMNESGAGVFPSSERTLSVAWEDAEWAFGRYQVLATVIYGDEARKTMTAATSFWVLPAQPIAITLGSILAFFLVLFFGVRGYIAKRLKDMGVSGKSRTLHADKYRSSLSQTLTLVVGVVVVCVLLLGGLFIFFA